MRILTAYEVENIITRHPDADAEMARHWLSDIKSSAVAVPLFAGLALYSRLNHCSRQTIDAILEGQAMAKD